MSYIGNQPTSVAFLTDQFSGTGSQTAFTLSAAPANTASILVAVSGVLQDPTTYSTSGLTLTFSSAPPSGTGNISVRYLGIPASNITTTAYSTRTDFTATAGQTTFTVPSYTVNFIQVYRNGVLLGSADYTATTGTTVVLATAATAGDLVTTISFYVSSVLGAIPATNGAVTTPYILDGAVTAAKMAASGAWAPSGTVIQVVNQTFSTNVSTTGGVQTDSGITATITPKLSTSRIVIAYYVNGITSVNSSTSTTRMYLTDGSNTQLAQVYDQWVTAGTSGPTEGFSGTFSLLPATTAAQTYKIRYANTAVTGVQINSYWNGGGVTSSGITLMEVVV